MIEFQLTEHEIEVEVLDLGGLEDIGIALTRTLLGVGLVIDITSIIDRSLEERYVELSIKVELVEVVLDDGDIEVVECIFESINLTLLTRRVVNDILQTRVERDAGAVDEHVLHREGHRVVAVANLDGLGEAHVDLLDEESLPELVLARGDTSLGTVKVLLGEDHAVAIARGREIDDDRRGAKGEARQIDVLKLIEVGLDEEVVPARQRSLYMDHCTLLRRFTRVIDLLEIFGHLHIDVEGQTDKLVVAPSHEAAVCRLYDIGRRLESTLKSRLLLLDDKVLEQGHHATLGDETGRTDTEARRTKDEDLLLRDLALRNDTGTKDIHRGKRRSKLHLVDGQSDGCRIILFGDLQREGHVLQIALQKVGDKRLALLEVLVVLCDFGQVIGQTTYLAIGLLLQTVGIGQSCVTDKVVDTPVGEEFVNDLRGAHLHTFLAAPCLDHTLIDLVFGVDGYVGELHGKLPCEQQRRPHHMAVAREVTGLTLHSLQVAIEDELVFTYHHLAATQVVGRPVGGVCVLDVYLVATLEEIVADTFRHGRVEGVERVVEEVDRLLVERLRNDAQEEIVALGNLLTEHRPANGVAALGEIPVGVDRLLLEHLLPILVLAGRIELHVVAEADRVLSHTVTGIVARPLPIEIEGVAHEELSCSSVRGEIG